MASPRLSMPTLLVQWQMAGPVCWLAVFAVRPPADPQLSTAHMTAAAARRSWQPNSVGTGGLTLDNYRTLAFNKVNMLAGGTWLSASAPAPAPAAGAPRNMSCDIAGIRLLGLGCLGCIAIRDLD